ncbi:TetR/AcrR family transcriptional regulator [Dermatophilus congolensis]|uniref:TetR/AcrR family transcriptional regulator n=1 Tax=Dermatophilus congolensis TaxID=1863 RepID=UPI001AAE262B|nr:TetR/AcrR family transcriptional regulator [Dermatophilus congolensis]MBO3142719.1 TetR/AcrR family transcriptional regulator [Dermatophilus congolensis]MBO3151711.1 TetR/AcrR family transcriptional regulator [Dermatophilus congolensis]MBO3161289.1 TetR/AcrR family transcriptional regulator [Dermatophilus congolensis]MBO3162992.1 TetR/AcrR family transcriptional regulator [Dermatophilus congolensis]MBO3176544.1 TetR/AcrR family transcriptional regulator [Dermatophilus congolensis]
MPLVCTFSSHSPILVDAPRSPIDPGDNRMNNSHGTTISPRRARTRARLVEAATTLFVRNGVIATTVEQIAEEAGFTRGAFYSNFSDKDELIVEVLIARSESIAQAIENATVCPTADFSGVVDAFLASHPMGPEYFTMMNELALLAIRRGDPGGTFGRWSTEFNERTARLVSQGLASLGREPLIDPSDLTEVLSGVFERAIRASLLRGAPPNMLRRLLVTTLTHMTRPIEALPSTTQTPEPTHAE